MITTKGSPGQIVKFSGKIGGALRVFEDKVEVLVGGFTFNKDDLPAPGDVLPCATPVYCDEAAGARSITPLITGKVASIDQTDAKKVTLANIGLVRPAFKVGSKVAIINSTLTHEYQNTAASGNDPASYAFATIVAYDENVITLDNALDSLAADDILVEVAEDETTHKAAVKCTPNTLLPYDKVYDKDATIVYGDGCYDCKAPVLERRCPPITDAVKAALDAGGCTFRWSQRK